MLIRVEIFKFGEFVEMKIVGNCINAEALLFHFNLKASFLFII